MQYRLVGPSAMLRRQIEPAVHGLAEANFVLEIPFVKLTTLEGFPSMVAAFTTDVPYLSQWGTPLLLGPGSIHVAHTDQEYIAKSDLLQAVHLYCDIARRLVA